MKVSGQLHAPAALPAGKNLGTHCIGGWVGPESRSWWFRELKHFFPLPEFESRTVQSVS